MGSCERAEKRTSFKWAGAHESNTMLLALAFNCLVRQLRNGAIGPSDMADTAAREAVERSGSERDTIERHRRLKRQIGCDFLQFTRRGGRLESPAVVTIALHKSVSSIIAMITGH
jgi:hypothetical protein